MHKCWFLFGQTSFKFKSVTNNTCTLYWPLHQFKKKKKVKTNLFAACNHVIHTEKILFYQNFQTQRLYYSISGGLDRSQRNKAFTPVAHAP